MPPTVPIRSRRPVALAALTVGALVAAGLAAVPASAATASNTLTVNVAQALRPVTHVATGSLYGLATATQPTVALAQAIKPNTFVQMPAGGHQQPTGDISVVAPTAVAVGAKLVDRLSEAVLVIRQHRRLRTLERVGQHGECGQRDLRGLLDDHVPADRR